MPNLTVWPTLGPHNTCCTRLSHYFMKFGPHVAHTSRKPKFGPVHELKGRSDLHNTCRCCKRAISAKSSPDSARICLSAVLTFYIMLTKTFPSRKAKMYICVRFKDSFGITNKNHVSRFSKASFVLLFGFCLVTRNWSLSSDTFRTSNGCNLAHVNYLSLNCSLCHHMLLKGVCFLSFF